MDKRALLVMSVALSVLAATSAVWFFRHCEAAPRADAHPVPAATSAPDLRPAAGPAPAATAPAADARPAPTNAATASAMPAQSLSPYLSGRTPVETLADGTQIYDNIPYKVRQPDGSMKEMRCRMTISPTKAVSILPADLEELQKKP